MMDNICEQIEACMLAVITQKLHLQNHFYIKTNAPHADSFITYRLNNAKKTYPTINTVAREDVEKNDLSIPPHVLLLELDSFVVSSLLVISVMIYCLLVCSFVRSFVPSFCPFPSQLLCFFSYPLFRTFHLLFFGRRHKKTKKSEEMEDVKIRGTVR